MLRGKSDVALVFNRPVGGNRGERFSRVLGYRRRDEQPKARPLSRAQERGISHAYTCGVRHHLGRSHWPRRLFLASSSGSRDAAVAAATQAAQTGHGVILPRKWSAQFLRRGYSNKSAIGLFADTDVTTAWMGPFLELPL